MSCKPINVYDDSHTLFRATDSSVARSTHQNDVIDFCVYSVFSADYCAFEYFNVTCRMPDELLYIRSARYGRMRIGGRCVKVDLGFVGCAVDVSHVISARCTGRPHCAMAVGDAELRMRRPCPTDVTWYLEVSHMCVKGNRSSYLPCWALFLTHERPQHVHYCLRFARLSVTKPTTTADKHITYLPRQPFFSVRIGQLACFH